jgi:pilus assembly protein CpaE
MMKISILSPSKAALERISTLIAQMSDVGQPSRHEGFLARLPEVVQLDQPDVLIVDEPVESAQGLLAVEQVTASHPGLFVIMSCAGDSRELLLEAMRAGVRELLPAPFTAEALGAALRRALHLRSRATAGARARLIGFMAAKGGAGSTFLAASTAHALALRGSRVLLIDLDLRFGEALLTVHERAPEVDIVQIAAQVSRLDTALLASAVVPVSPRFHVLGTAGDLMRATQVSGDQLDAVLDVARTAYDFIVLDLPRTIDDLAIRALDRLDRLFLVLHARVPHVRNAARLVQLFRSLGYGPEKLSAIVNRHTRAPDLSLDEIRPVLDGVALSVVGDDEREVARSIDLGVPLSDLSPNSIVIRHVGALADLVLPVAVDTGASVISRLFGRVRADRKRSEHLVLDRHS